MKATRAFFSICANLGLLSGSITPSIAIPAEHRSSLDRPPDEKKAGKEQSKVNKKREFKQGPCAFPFMENCITGPYVSASFGVGSSEASGSSASTENYTIGGTNLAVNNNSTSAISNDFSYAPDLGIGYDFGGVRAELSYNYSGVGSSSASISSTSLFTASGDEGDRFEVPFQSSTTSETLNYTSHRIIASLAVDIPTGSRFTPYLAGGIGPAWVSVKSSNLNTIDPCIPSGLSCPATFSTTGGTAIALALQAKAGLAYFISPRSSLFIEAVYDYTSSVNVGNIELDDFGQYSTKFGFRYKL